MTPVVLLAGTLAQEEGPDPNSVSPGVLGFLVFFALAIATILLIRSFNTQMRRVDRNERRRQAEEEAAAQPADDDVARLLDGDATPDAPPDQPDAPQEPPDDAPRR